jgi:CheY-like chemotaxis protein
LPIYWRAHRENDEKILTAEGQPIMNAHNGLAKPVDVLLVEDSRVQAELVKWVLAELPTLDLLDVVGDGVEAMAYLHREGKYQSAKRPGLVLLDINMPRKNGFEVLNEMKADPDLRKIPVVMLTTSTDDHDIVKSYEDGASTYIAKPVKTEDLERIFRHFSHYWVQTARLPPQD